MTSVRGLPTVTAPSRLRGANSQIRRATLASLSLCVLLPMHSLSATLRQGSSIVIPDEPECRGCRVAIRRTIDIGERQGEAALLSSINAVRVDSRGRYWVMDGDQPAAVFDSLGKFVTRVGASGSGPGETIRPLDAIALPGDSVLLFDGELSRLTVFDSQLRAVRTIPLGMPMRPWLLLSWPDLLVANGSIGTPESAGWPLHISSLAGQVLQFKKSFGPGDGALRPHERMSQLLAPAREENHFWAADQMQYRLSLWTKEAEKVVQLERRPKWFAETSRNDIGTPDRPPQPRLSCIAEDNLGYIWVVTRVAKATWRKAWPETRFSEYPVSQIAFERMFRSTIEVLNWRTRRVVARVDLDDWVFDCLPDRRVAAYNVDAEGIARVRILWLDVTR